MSRTYGSSPLVRTAALCAALLVAAPACADERVPGTGYEVEWIEGGEAVPVTREGIERGLADAWPDAMEVRSGKAAGDTPPITLGSCQDYLDVADRQVRPYHAPSPDHAIFQARALDCQARVLALAARPAAVSHLRTLAFDETLPDQLPWQVAMILSGAEADRIAAERPRATWREALFAPLAGFSSCGAYCVSYSGEAQTVSLVARGDFDGDGVEDMLLWSHEAAVGGSYRATRMFLLTRRTPEGQVELIRELES